MITNDKFLNKIEFVVSNVLKVLFFSIIFGLLLLSIVGSAIIDRGEHTAYVSDNVIINISSILIISAIAIILKRKNIKINKYFLYSITAVWFALCIYWIFLTKLQPRYDQKHIIDTAMDIWKRDFSFYRKRFIFGAIPPSIWYYIIYLWFNMYFQ